MERIIEIKGLRVLASIGVPAKERAQLQELSFDLRFAAALQAEMLNDDLAETVDYAAVSERLAKLVQIRPRKLIETLADEITAILLEEFLLSWIEIKVRKFILSNAEYVAVTVTRKKIED